LELKRSNPVSGYSYVFPSDYQIDLGVLYVRRIKGISRPHRTTDTHRHTDTKSYVGVGRRDTYDLSKTVSVSLYL
jgi:hypothetical protein